MEVLERPRVAVAGCESADRGLSRAIVEVLREKRPRDWTVAGVEALVEELRAFIAENADRISAAYVGVLSDRLRFVVVQVGVAADDELADRTTDFDIRLADDPRFDGLPLEVLDLPKVSDSGLTAFLPKDGTFRLPSRAEQD